MSNPFGGFVHTSPLFSLPHDPLHSVSSNIIRDYFGPAVQTIADCLLSQCCSGGIADRNHNTNSNSISNEESPGLTLSEIERKITKVCKRTLNEEREKLVKKVNFNQDIIKTVTIHMAKGPESSGYVVDRTTIRAALLVLVQHSIVFVVTDENTMMTNNEKEKKKQRHHKAYRYKLDPHRARFIPRYPRFVEHSKQAIDENAGAIVEEVLMHGRMRAEDILTKTTESVYQFLSAGRDDDDDDDNDDDDDENDDNDSDNNNINEEEKKIKNKEMQKKKQGMIDAEKAEIRVGILRSLKKLVDGGYLEKVEPIELPLLNNDENITNKNDRKRKLSSIVDENNTNINDTGNEATPEDELIDSDNEDGKKQEEFEQDLASSLEISPDSYDVLALLRKHPNSRMFPTGSVWRVNINMFHNVLRALILGHLIKERYEDKVPAAGSIITAALKLIAYEEHAPKKYALSQAEKQRREEEKGIFSAEELMNYIPTPVLHAFKNKAGGGKSNIHMALVALSQLDWPQVVMEVEGGRFELATRQMVKYLQGRILHQVVKDHMGDVAARICSLLEVKGYLEPDAVAKSAMVPAQDAREVSHTKNERK